MFTKSRKTVLAFASAGIVGLGASAAMIGLGASAAYACDSGTCGGGYGGYGSGPFGGPVGGSGDGSPGNAPSQSVGDTGNGGLSLINASIPVCGNNVGVLNNDAVPVIGDLGILASTPNTAGSTSNNASCEGQQGAYQGGQQQGSNLGQGQ